MVLKKWLRPMLKIPSIKRGRYIAVKLDESKIKTWRMPLTGEAPEGIWHDRYYAPGTKFSKS